MKNEIFNLYLIVACIFLAFGCYYNYQGWAKCVRNKEYIADDLYKLQKEKIDMSLKISILQYQLDKKTK
jgi:hypothetical protein